MITGSFSCLLSLRFTFNPILANPICLSGSHPNFSSSYSFLLNVPERSEPATAPRFLFFRFKIFFTALLEKTMDFQEVYKKK